MWLINDETALVLRKLKDADGNYLWNQANDTILGKPVMISEFMPGISSGKKPIAFGDFSYYWVISRSPIYFRVLFEKFALNNQVGYLPTEYLDAKLVGKDAIITVFQKGITGYSTGFIWITPLIPRLKSHFCA